MVTAMTATNSQVTASKKEHELMVKEPIAVACVDSEVAALKKQVSKLQNQLTTKKPRVPDASATGLKIEPVQHAQSEGRQQTFSDSDYISVIAVVRLATFLLNVEIQRIRPKSFTS